MDKTPTHTTPVDGILRVAATSSPATVAGAIAGMFRDGHKEVLLSAIGAGAVNQTVKAIGIARGYVAPAGLNLAAIPSFQDEVLSGEGRTVMRFRVFSL